MEADAEAGADTASPGGHADLTEPRTAPRAGGGLSSQKDLRKKARGKSRP